MPASVGRMKGFVIGMNGRAPSGSYGSVRFSLLVSKPAVAVGCTVVRGQHEIVRVQGKAPTVRTRLVTGLTADIMRKEEQ